jgi:HK97 family phage portal protein
VPILRALGAALERRAIDPTLPFGDSTPPAPGTWAATAAGTVVSEQTALQVAAVYGSVSVISEAVSALPTDLMTSPHRRTGQTLAPSQLAIQPYAEISLTDWWTQFVMSLALRGNFYGQIISRDAQLYPTQIKPIHPDHAQVRRLSSGTVEYRFNSKPVRVEDVFHVRLLSVAESLVGLNPIEYLRNVIGGARAGDLYGNAFFQNSARADVVIEVEDDLDDDQAKALARAWMNAHQGIAQSNLPAVLSGGATISDPITVSPRDAQFLEARQISASTISGQIFRVPPHMIGIVDRSTSWGRGIEQQELGFVRNTLIGYLTRGERAMTAMHPPGQFFRFDLSERLRGDRLERAQANTLEIASGTLTPDEARAGEDRPDLPDGIGKVALAPINAQSLQQLALASIAAAKQPDQPPPEPDQGGETGRTT